MSKSLADQFAERGERITELEKALQAATEGVDLAKGQVATVSQERDTLRTALDASKKELADGQAAWAAEKAGIEKDRADLQAKLTAAEAKLTLAPFKDVSAGTQPVPDGGAAPEKTATKPTGEDLVDQMLALAGHERTKFYLENRAAIDAAYDSRWMKK
jgi:chromosome segregation ATPase